jgi:hypothetical protein
MKFVCTGIFLVVLLALALARPNYFPRLQYEAEISQQYIRCYGFPFCGVDFIREVSSREECCSILRGKSFLEINGNIGRCYNWLVQRDQLLNFVHIL